MSSPKLMVAAAGAALACGLIGAPTAGAEEGPLLGTAEPSYLTATSAQRGFLFDETVAAHAGIVRMNAFWYVIAPNEPTHLPRSPVDPAYHWAELDAAVRAASDRGLEVFFTLQRAPAWAERGSDGQDRGAYRPDVKAFGDYATAVATRYSGHFPDPKRLGQFLPRVRYYQAWNEANLEKFFAPQVQDGKRVSVENYRKLLNHAYDEIKAVDADNQVVIAGSAPTAPTSGARTVSTTFWRELFCLSKGLQPLPCPDPVNFDVFDHHPITVKQPPNARPPKGQVLIRNYREVGDILRAAEAAGTIGGPAVHPMWASEVYWETDPPETKRGFPPERAARFLEQSIYLLHKQGVEMILNFFLIDAPLDRPGNVANVQGGLLWADGSHKPSFRAFRFPFLTERLSSGMLRIWGMTPSDGVVRVERRVDGHWERLASYPGGEGQVFTDKLDLPAGLYRASIPGERSLVWEQND